MIKPIEEFDYKQGVGIDDVTVTYVQTNDCTESEDDVQTMTLSSRNNGIARFINIKTGENGWSIDPNEDLTDIIKDFINRASIVIKNEH